jgi:prepilin-type N-terminal cleavage/methylation domain-containing protein
MITHMNKRQSRGFTLIELLVVIAIIGILSSVVLASLNSARKKGRDARRISDLKQIQLALELYYDNTQSEYPDALSDLAPAYIATVPEDPQTSDPYDYGNLTGAGAGCTRAGGVCSNYILGATLEDGANSALAQDVDTASPAEGPTTCADAAAPFVYCVQP